MVMADGMTALVNQSSGYDDEVFLTERPRSPDHTILVAWSFKSFFRSNYMLGSADSQTSEQWKTG